MREREHAAILSCAATVDRASCDRHGAGVSRRLTDSPANVLHHHALDTLHHYRSARTGRAQRDAAAIDWTARHLGRHQYPLFVRLSVLAGVLRRGADRIGRSYSLADRGVLAVVVARRAVPDPRHRHDAAGHERSL